MSKKCDGHDRVRVYPENKKALKRLLARLTIPTTFPKLANEAMRKGVEMIVKNGNGK